MFRSVAGESAPLAGQIASAIEAEFGFQPRVFILGLYQLEAAIAANLFTGRDIDPKLIHLFFSARQSTAWPKRRCGPWRPRETTPGWPGGFSNT